MKEMKQIGSFPFGQMEIHTFEGDPSGPKAAITAGIHGDEQTGVHTARLILKALESARVKGVIKVLPVCNPTAFMRRQRRSPFDDVDMNRIFPGKPQGTLTYQTASLIWEETAFAQYSIDLHCCCRTGSSYALVDYQHSEKLRELCKVLGIPAVCQTGGTRGQLFLDSFLDRGQNSLLIELPGGQPGGVIDLPAAEFCAQRVLNYLRYIGALEGEAQTDYPVTFYGKISGKAAWEDGLFLPKVSSETPCVKGQVLGTLNGQEILADYDGTVTFIASPQYCFTGENLVNTMPLEGK